MAGRWLSERRTVVSKTTPHKGRSSPAPSAPPNHGGPAPALPSPRHLAWLLVQAPETLSASEAAIVRRIEQDGEVAPAIALVRRLADLVRRCTVGHPDQDRPREPIASVDAWLADAACCGVPAIETFAAGLHQDAGAVRAALTLPWSSGQTEGQITKLKRLKRQMYGRGSFDVLRRRVLLAA